MNSIRSRLLLSLGSFLVVTLVAAGLFLGSWFKNRLEREFDAGLETRLSAIAGLLENEPEGLEFDFSPTALPEFSDQEKPSYFEVRRGDEIVYKSPTLESTALNLQNLQTAWSAAIDFKLAELPVRGQAREYRVHQLNREEDETKLDPIDLTILVASFRGDLDDDLAEFRMGLFGAILLLLAVCAATTTLAVRYGLRPLDEIARTVGSLHHDDLGQGLSLKGDVRELRPLVETLDVAFLRLKAAYDREREMTSNVAHELRTPLAELRAATDLAGQWPDDAELVAAALSTASAVSQRMERLVAALLRLARLQSNSELARNELCDLSALLDLELKDLQAKAEDLDRKFVVLNEVVPQLLFIKTDPDLVRLALKNLLRNALEHADSDSAEKITIRLMSRGAERVLAVENPCKRAKHLIASGRLTEAFWRGDAARSGHSNEGLGLAICAQVMATLAGELVLSAGQGSFIAELVFRASDPADHRAEEIAQAGSAEDGLGKSARA